MKRRPENTMSLVHLSRAMSSGISLVYYRVAGHTQEHAIATVLQMSDLESDGMTLNTVKGDASATVQINAP
jgi:hypothetical protein